MGAREPPLGQADDPAKPIEPEVVCEQCGGRGLRRRPAPKGNPFFAKKIDRWVCADCGVDLGEAPRTSSPGTPW